MDIEKIRKIYSQSVGSNEDREFPVSLKGFNWGAFLLTFIWGIPHKAWITLIAIPLIWFQLPFGFNWFLLTVFQVYCGFKGNEWAYKSSGRISDYEFKMNQIKWTIFAFVLNLTLPVLVLTLFIMFFVKSPDNPVNFVQNAQCKVASEKIYKAFPSLALSSRFNENELADKFAQQFPNAKADNNIVNFSIQKSNQSVELYQITFNMDKVRCNLNKQNCSIHSGFLIPPELFEQTQECLFYFDSVKKVQPTDATRQNIEKGYNIFKYL